jgi:hypothetical protein
MISFKGIQFPKDVISLKFEESTNRVGTPSGIFPSLAIVLQFSIYLINLDHCLYLA